MASETLDADAPARSRYVGRKRELEAIETALAGALSGRGRIVLVQGEPGIGKSRLLAEVERLARERGLPVAWGRSLEADGAPPYWPWRQVLRALPRTRDTPSGVNLVDRIAPELAGAGDDPDPDGAADLQGAERFGVFDAVRELLLAAAAPSGLLVLLDDVHWADAPSLRLLEHLAHDWGETRALLIAAHRPVGIDRDAPLRQSIAQLSRVEGTERITLEGFTPEETAARLADVSGRRFPAAAVKSLQERTGGNPFFVSEFGLLLAGSDTREPDAGPDVPQSVRDVIARRVSRLSRSTQRVLEVAAVVGAQPSPNVVAAVLEVPVAGVLDGFDEAAGDGVLTRDSDRIEYSFAHALLRDALYTELPAAQRVELHARIATEVERLAGADRASHLSEIAHHWLQAMPAGHADAAAESAAAAAEAAMTQLAYEEAARLFEAASGACAQAAADPRRRAHLLLSAARGRFLSGELERAAALCEDAARLARSADDATLVGEAALVMEGVGDPAVSTLIAGLCRDALAMLPDDEVRMRSRLLGQLTTALVYLDDFEPLDRVSREALEGAERAGDDDTIAAALRARHIACSDADGLGERVAIAERLLAMSVRSHRIVDEMWARLWNFDAALQRGLVDDCDREIAAIDRIATRIKQPLVAWHVERCRVAVAHARGDFDAARHAADEGDRFARAAGGLARPRRQMQYIILAVSTGDDLPEAAFASLTKRPEDNALPPTAVLIGLQTMALALVFRGETQRAAAIYEDIPAPERWSVMPPAAFIALSHHAALAGLLGLREDSAALYRRIQPYADLFVTAGAGAVACFGSAEFQLGVLSRAMARTDTAVKHLERAVERNEQAGMRPAAAESRYQLALTLQARARSGDVAAALPLVSASLEAADALGMRPLATRATALRDSLRAGTRQARVLTPREVEIARMVAEGLTSREIAEAMHISSRTADNHVQHILDKLDLRSRNQIAAWVARSAARPASEM